MQTNNDKHTWFMIYEDIIRDSLINAKRYERYDKTRELSKEYLKVIDELIQCINEKHKNDFLFDRIHDGNEYLFRSIFLADEEEEEDMKEEEVPTSTKEDEQPEHPEIPVVSVLPDSDSVLPPIPPVEIQPEPEYIDYDAVLDIHSILQWRYNEKFLKDIIIHAFSRINIRAICQGLDGGLKIRWDSIPEEKMNEWYDYLFNYDATKWETRNPIKALDPFDSFNHPEYTTNELQNILKIRAYELEDRIISFLIEHTDQIPEDMKRKGLGLCLYEQRCAINEATHDLLVTEYSHQEEESRALSPKGEPQN